MSRRRCRCPGCTPKRERYVNPDLQIYCAWIEYGKDRQERPWYYYKHRRS